MVKLAISTLTIALLAGSTIAAPIYEGADIQQRSPRGFGGLARLVSIKSY